MRGILLRIVRSSFFGNLLPIVFDSSKYLYWVQNSPFVQMKKDKR